MDVTLPSAAGAFGEPSELTSPDSEAPRGLHVRVLEEGSGPMIQKGRQIEVNYLGQIWNGRVPDSSFRRDETTLLLIGVRMVIKGWDQTLVGKNVGSRLLVPIPPERGCGPRGNPRAGIRGTDTLILVVNLVSTR